MGHSEGQHAHPKNGLQKEDGKIAAFLLLFLGARKVKVIIVFLGKTAKRWVLCFSSKLSLWASSTASLQRRLMERFLPEMMDCSTDYPPQLLMAFPPLVLPKRWQLHLVPFDC